MWPSLKGTSRRMSCAKACPRICGPLMATNEGIPHGISPGGCAPLPFPLPPVPDPVPPVPFAPVPAPEPESLPAAPLPVPDPWPPVGIRPRPSLAATLTAFRRVEPPRRRAACAEARAAVRATCKTMGCGLAMIWRLYTTGCTVAFRGGGVGLSLCAGGGGGRCTICTICEMILSGCCANSLWGTRPAMTSCNATASANAMSSRLR